MNIAALLKEALASGDWSFVAQAYFMLSGEKVDPMESDAFSLLSVILNKIQEIKDDMSDKPKKKKPDKPKIIEKKEEIDKQFLMEYNKPSRKISGNQSENKFELMSDAIAEAERESGYDKINDNVTPTKRSRKTYSTKKVVCTECNRSFDVNPMFAKDNYICDKCLQRRGR